MAVGGRQFQIENLHRDAKMTPQRAQQRTHRSKRLMNLKKGGCFSGIKGGLLRLLRGKDFNHGNSI